MEVENFWGGPGTRPLHTIKNKCVRRVVGVNLVYNSYIAAQQCCEYRVIGPGRGWCAYYKAPISPLKNLLLARPL